MNAHTQGPWRVEPSFKTIVSNGKFKVCDTDTSYAYPPEEETLANARLIAAAPELLSALKIVLCSASPNPFEHPRMATAWSIAHEAIAKAEGRES